uniref:NADH:ubiquinone reductase (H(+)-translocating) n=1 Tax=Anoplocephala perfoliata TaxID=218192 RepID=A0A0N7DID8_9CEST|nr:NADH dehydrogenase subunit 5 [Anoplocephala perfoliata]AKU46902.1 NADH dehydrogenase subunit 5 [Anoplocephala perfoliata]
MIFVLVSIFLLSILCFSLFLCFYYIDLFVSLKFLSLSGGVVSLDGEFDVVTISILLMLVGCFLYVFFYTGHYFGGGLDGIKLNNIICLFVGVMAVLVCTGDFFSTLVLWEYLGVVSYFLILFYDNYLSLRSSIITLVSSRFGDVCLFILLCISGYLLKGSLGLVSMVLFLIIFTKSASFPFVSWLLEAMRAPTPVSSLVHSSTLVAAGIWFTMRYDFLLYLNDCFYYSVCLLSTIVITGVSSFFFVDLKKIVALSTCNNISWCVFYLIFGDYVLSLLQLISHGISKCMLFILVGDIMSGTGGSQASNCVYNSRLYGNWGIFGLFCIILGLSGAPFIGVFFTKHFLLSNFMNIFSISLSSLTMLCVFLSYFYSFRFCSILVNLKSSVTSGSFYSFNLSGIVYFWLFVNYFIFYMLDENNLLNVLNSVSLIVFQLISCVIAWFMYSNTSFAGWSSSLFGCDNIVEGFYELFLKILLVVNSSIYRWDNYVLNLFSGGGISSLSVFTVSFLNIIILIVLIFLMCWFIVYN